MFEYKFVEGTTESYVTVTTTSTRPVIYKVSDRLDLETVYFNGYPVVTEVGGIITYTLPLSGAPGTDAFLRVDAFVDGLSEAMTRTILPSKKRLAGISEFPYANLTQYRSGEQETPRVDRITFGDGYRQQVSRGINPIDSILQVTFQDKPERIAELVKWFNNRNNKEFYYAFPNSFSKKTGLIAETDTSSGGLSTQVKLPDIYETLPAVMGRAFSAAVPAVTFRAAMDAVLYRAGQDAVPAVTYRAASDAVPAVTFRAGSSTTTSAPEGDLSVPANKNILSGTCYGFKSATGLPSVYDGDSQFSNAGEIDNLVARINGIDYAVATCFEASGNYIFLYNADNANLTALPATIPFQLYGVDYVGERASAQSRLSVYYTVTPQLTSLNGVQTSPILIGIAGDDGFYGDGEVIVSTTVTVPERPASPFMPAMPERQAEAAIPEVLERLASGATPERQAEAAIPEVTAIVAMPEREVKIAQDQTNPIGVVETRTRVHRICRVIGSIDEQYLNAGTNRVDANFEVLN